MEIKLADNQMNYCLVSVNELAWMVSLKRVEHVYYKFGLSLNHS